MLTGDGPTPSPSREGPGRGALSPRGSRFVRERLELMGLTQEKLAGRVGVSPSALSRYLNGRRSLPASCLFAICEEIDLDPREVWG